MLVHRNACSKTFENRFTIEKVLTENKFEWGFSVHNVEGGVIIFRLNHVFKVLRVDSNSS